MFLGHYRQADRVASVADNSSSRSGALELDVGNGEETHVNLLTCRPSWPILLRPAAPPILKKNRHDSDGKQVPGSALSPYGTFFHGLAHQSDCVASVDVCFLAITDMEFDTVMEVLVYRQFLSIMEGLVYQGEVPSSGPDGTSS